MNVALLLLTHKKIQRHAAVAEAADSDSLGKILRLSAKQWNPEQVCVWKCVGVCEYVTPRKWESTSQSLFIRKSSFILLHKYATSLSSMSLWPKHSLPATAQCNCCAHDNKHLNLE